VVRLMTHDTYGDGPICDKTEMPQAWCGDCRTYGPGHRAVTEGESGGGGERFDATGAVRFTARYPGTCDECGRDFPEGSWIGLTLDHKYICESCAQ
jgi:hypothetical protein